MMTSSWRTLVVNLLEKRQFSLKKLKLDQSDTTKRIRVTDRIYLRPYDKVRKESLQWYQDPVSMRYIVGSYSEYSIQQIRKMYDWQKANGSLYYIEYKKNDQSYIVGDVWLAEDDYAIVIDEAFRNQHIGRTVTKYFIYKARKLGREYLTVSEIFKWNKASQQMFEHLGFSVFAHQKDSLSYRKKLN